MWQAGPVCSDIYQELNEQPYLLEDYIELSFDKEGTKVTSRKQFRDDEFSDNEIALMQTVIETFQYKSAAALVELTHRESSPWFKAAQENNLLELFAAKKTNTTNCKINLGELIKGDVIKAQLFQEYQEYHNAVKSLKP